MILKKNREKIIQLAWPIFVLVVFITPLLSGPVLIAAIIVPAVLGAAICFYLVEKIALRFLIALAFLLFYPLVNLLVFWFLKLIGVLNHDLLESIGQTWVS